MVVREHNPESGSLDPASNIGPGSDTAAISTVDPVSDVLETIRLQGAIFFLWEPSWPYGIGVADGGTLSKHLLPETECVVSYHIVTDGPCWAAVEGEPPVELETGDTLVLPRGDAYKIANTPQYPTAEDAAASVGFFSAMAAGAIPPVVTDGGAGPEVSRLICGFLGCNIGPYNPLLSTLPAMIRIPAPVEDNDPLSALVQIAVSESRASRGGERCLLLRLSEVMFVEVLRRFLRSDSDLGSSWVAGLRDPLVARVIALLHQDVSVNWTLQTLAQSAGASRSTLAERFTRIIGLPPIQYLTRWRMQVAAYRLRDNEDKIYAIAREVGYDSEQAFSRAFKRVTGMTPRGWRERS